MESQNKYQLSDAIGLFRENSRPGYIPPHLPGETFVKHFGLKGGDIEHFFDLMCYQLEVLSINPGMDEMSYHWEENDFGLREPYLTHLKRDMKISELGL